MEKETPEQPPILMEDAESITVGLSDSQIRLITRTVMEERGLCPDEAADCCFMFDSYCRGHLDLASAPGRNEQALTFFFEGYKAHKQFAAKGN